MPRAVDSAQLRIHRNALLARRGLKALDFLLGDLEGALGFACVVCVADPVLDVVETILLRAAGEVGFGFGAESG